MKNVAKVKVESVEVQGDWRYDLIKYNLKYEEYYECWYWYPPTTLRISARTTIEGKVYRCPVRLEVGKEYIVGYNGYFRFVKAADNLTWQDQILLGHGI
ncbi:hypothetical protein Y032_0028g1652 [Ancylostoma ceylanicum]|uniref:Uncharacterized protein n=1 Tax=Ancylostoma ceylanicum TaxID=53326 RepID=A0A016USA8_9BILA|nr:hypothetical protein Y032_0028g1652 [Ancylostoma ceylanicum]